MAPDIDNKNGVEMADIASINGQDAPSGGGGTATAAPALSLAGGGFGVIVATITKSGGGAYTNPNYEIIILLITLRNIALLKLIILKKHILALCMIPCRLAILYHLSN